MSNEKSNKKEDFDFASSLFVDSKVKELKAPGGVDENGNAKTIVIKYKEATLGDMEEIGAELKGKIDPNNLGEMQFLLGRALLRKCLVSIDGREVTPRVVDLIKPLHLQKLVAIIEGGFDTQHEIAPL